MGYATLFSCSGHRQNGMCEDGYIIINGEYGSGELNDVFAILGLDVKSIKVSSKMDWFGEWTDGKVSDVRFVGLGGSKTFYKDRLDFMPSISYDDFRSSAFLFSRNLHRVGVHHSSRMARQIMYAFSEALSGREVRVP